MRAVQILDINSSVIDEKYHLVKKKFWILWKRSFEICFN